MNRRTRTRHPEAESRSATLESKMEQDLPDRRRNEKVSQKVKTMMKGDRGFGDYDVDNDDDNDIDNDDKEYDNQDV